MTLLLKRCFSPPSSFSFSWTFFLLFYFLLPCIASFLPLNFFLPSFPPFIPPPSVFLSFPYFFSSLHSVFHLSSLSTFPPHFFTSYFPILSFNLFPCSSFHLTFSSYCLLSLLLSVLTFFFTYFLSAQCPFYNIYLYFVPYSNLLFCQMTTLPS